MICGAVICVGIMYHDGLRLGEEKASPQVTTLRREEIFHSVVRILQSVVRFLWNRQRVMIDDP
jgi:hypothetical protein